MIKNGDFVPMSQHALSAFVIENDYEICLSQDIRDGKLGATLVEGFDDFCRLRSSPAEKELLAPHPLLLPPPPPPPRISQDSLSVTNTRTFPSSGSEGEPVAGAESIIAATTFGETPSFLSSIRSLSES
jgi:hypothetical protein